MDLGEIPQPRGLAPPGVADAIANIEWRAATVAAARVGEVVGMAPLALEPLPQISHEHPQDPDVPVVAACHITAAGAWKDLGVSAITDEPARRFRIFPY
jgi:hypothetical protein